MGSCRGLIGRRLLTEIGQAMGSSSPNSPFPKGYVITPYDANSHIKLIPAIIIGIVAVTFLLSFLTMRFHFNWCCRGHAAPMLLNGPSPQGLHRSLVEALPVCVFSSATATASKKDKGGGGGCAICLQEFDQGEVLQLLPQCGHVFHLGCIGMWLFSHTNCPLCRHSLLLVAGRTQGEM